MGTVTRLLLLLFIVLASAGVTARGSGAGLVWERENIEVTAQPGQRVVRVEFPFRNAGDKVVTIASVETSCRCTSADSSKKSYAPGERDAITVDFAVGDQEGVVYQSVTVTTDGPEPNPFTLAFRVTIPPAAPAK
jgi:hypothetical protein